MGYIATALGGVVIGWLLRLLRERRQVSPVAEPRSDRQPLEPEVLRLSTTGYLVLNQAGRPLLSNARATQLGVLHAGIVDQQILGAVSRAAVSGETIDVELRPVSVPASLETPRTAPRPGR